MDNLGDALPREINRVRLVRETYKELRGMPGVIVEPQIILMQQAIQGGIDALASGDVVEMLRAYAALKEWKK